MSNANDDDWKVFSNDGKVHADRKIPAAPPWRNFAQDDSGEGRRRPRFIFEDHEIELINAALLLRRPLLITGKPGVGKSSLIYAVARELGLGSVLVWPINTRSTLENGLYRYDAIGRLQELEALRSRLERTPGAGSDKDYESSSSLGKYITLGPLGTAFLPHDRPRALLIDEIDKSDIDLPNDLLNLFEEGWYEIPVLARVADKWDQVPVRPYDADIGNTVMIAKGKVHVREFPFVVMTSNGERDFPQPFLRRCIRMHIEQPDAKKLGRIISDYFDDQARAESVQLIEDFFMRAHKGEVATDQLLNAVFLSTQYSVDLGPGKNPKALYELLLRDLKA